MTFALGSGLTAVFTGLVLVVSGTILGKYRHHYLWYIPQAFGVSLAGAGLLVAAVAFVSGLIS